MKLIGTRYIEIIFFSLNRSHNHLIPSMAIIINHRMIVIATLATQECSGQGLCNRTTGQCECQKPFIGAACEVAGCPSVNKQVDTHDRTNIVYNRCHMRNG